MQSELTVQRNRSIYWHWYRRSELSQPPKNLALTKQTKQKQSQIQMHTNTMMEAQQWDC
jgi:hypothetical protein